MALSDTASGAKFYTHTISDMAPLIAIKVRPSSSFLLIHRCSYPLLEREPLTEEDKGHYGDVLCLRISIGPCLGSF